MRTVLMLGLGAVLLASQGCAASIRESRLNSRYQYSGPSLGKPDKTAAQVTKDRWDCGGHILTRENHEAVDRCMQNKGYYTTTRPSLESMSVEREVQVNQILEKIQTGRYGP